MNAKKQIERAAANTDRASVFIRRFYMWTADDLIQMRRELDDAETRGRDEERKRVIEKLGADEFYRLGLA